MPFLRQVVFVVDDEKVIAETLATILNGAGFIALAFDDPCQALVSARETPPDLLISDVMMPGMTGVDLGIRLREITPECRVLLFSGKPLGDLAETLRSSGAEFEVLPKPMHPTDLLKRLRTAFEEDGLTALGANCR